MDPNLECSGDTSTDVLKWLLAFSSELMEYGPTLFLIVFLLLVGVSLDI